MTQVSATLLESRVTFDIVKRECFVKTTTCSLLKNTITLNPAKRDYIVKTKNTSSIVSDLSFLPRQSLPQGVLYRLTCIYKAESRWLKFFAQVWTRSAPQGGKEWRPKSAIPRSLVDIDSTCFGLGPPAMVLSKIIIQSTLEKPGSSPTAKAVRGKIRVLKSDCKGNPGQVPSQGSMCARVQHLIGTIIRHCLGNKFYN
jgi:hypothetical protein